MPSILFRLSLYGKRLGGGDLVHQRVHQRVGAEGDAGHGGEQRGVILINYAQQQPHHGECERNMAQRAEQRQEEHREQL